MSVYDQDVLTRDELIGDIVIDLDNVFRDGAREAWVPLMGPDDGSTDGPVGELHIRAELPEKTKAAAAAAAAAASARTSTTTRTTTAAAGAASAAAAIRAGDASAESSDSEDYAQDEDDEFRWVSSAMMPVLRLHHLTVAHAAHAHHCLVPPLQQRGDP